MDLKSYGSLAWTERIIVSGDACANEVEQYVNAIKEHANRDLKTMLHLGCGAGGHDYYFKRHFEVTGVDISGGMLNIAREANPDVSYVQGDMRSISLEQKFDVVIIPDSIAYMSTHEDLKKAIHTVASHLCPGGIFLVVAHIKEEFINNNFAYSGTDGDIHITVFENNHVISESQYEATLVYLIRQSGVLQVGYDVHTLGLFNYDTWLKFFSEAKLCVNASFNMDELYDEFLLGEGEYRLKVFICSLEGTK